MQTIETTLVVRADAVPGEGPMWHDAEEVLYWVDIMHGLIHRYDPATQVDTSIDVGEPVGAVVPRTSGGLIAALKDSIAAVDFPSGKIEKLVTVDDSGITRFNDGKCDRDGRFYVGTMGLGAQPGAGALYRLDPDGSVTTMQKPVTISNGLAWTSDNTTMYYIDSLAEGVDAYNYDAATGAMSGKRQFIALDPEADGLPDGCAIDAEDHLWVALHNAGQVRRYAPDGTHVATVEVPAKGTTSCCFAGPDLTELYITTAALGDDLGGSLFIATPGVAGTPTLGYAG